MLSTKCSCECEWNTRIYSQSNSKYSYCDCVVSDCMSQRGVDQFQELSVDVGKRVLKDFIDIGKRVCCVRVFCFCNECEPCVTFIMWQNTWWRCIRLLRERRAYFREQRKKTTNLCPVGPYIEEQESNWHHSQLW